MPQRTLLALLLLVFALTAKPQQVTVVDAATGQPVAHANLTTRDGGFHSATTDADGHATVAFPFQSLTVSHINYRPLRLTALPATVRLTPRERHISEVIVGSHEPEWIRPMLKRFVKEKGKRYLTRPDTLRYDYLTQSINGRKFYQYESRGRLALPPTDGDLYTFCQTDSGQITSADSTTLTDMSSMRRMLYADFVRFFDRGFIRSHRFAVDHDFEGRPGEVRLVFRAKGNDADHGHFVIDTLHLVILQATHTRTRGWNLAHLVSPFLLAMERVMSGYEIKAWDTWFQVTYDSIGGNYYPSAIRSKSFFESVEKWGTKENSEFNQATGSGFMNMESTLQTAPAAPPVPSAEPFLRLPKPWVIRINSDAYRAYEVRLAHLPARLSLLP